MNTMRHIRSSRGFSLIELMISIALALLLSLAIVQVLLSSKYAFVLDRESAIIQENARYALEVIRREASVAGTMCRPDANVANVVLGSGAADRPELGSPGIEGFDDADGDFPDEYASAAHSGTDSLYVRGVQGEPTYLNAVESLTNVLSGLTSSALGLILDLQNLDPTDIEQVIAVSLDLDVSNIVSGDILMISDGSCEQVLVAKTSEITGNNLIFEGAGVQNCEVGLGPGVGASAFSIFDCATVGTLTSTLPILDGSIITEYGAQGFYIADSAMSSDVPALWRSRLTTDSSGASVLIEEELVQGVENMQLLYGYDTDSTRDGVPDVYLKANDDSLLSGSWDWTRVMSVRVSLLMRSIDPIETVAFAQDDFEGVSIPSDRYLRHQIHTVIQLKNRSGY